MSVLKSAELSGLQLKNHIVMAPMTRSRAIGNIPNELIAEYYEQRSGAGLIITEGTSPSPNGLGYSRIPGIFSDEQVAGWKLVTDRVHAKNSKIFVQLMHTGRIGHESNLPEGAKVLAPSAVKAAGQIWSDSLQMVDHSEPNEMNSDELEMTKNEFVNAAKNAIKAGFDGIELHAANGYLLEQFLSPISNVRSDNYGGSIENRVRFVLEVVDATIEAIGKGKVGIRVSPYGVASDMPHYDEIEETYSYLSKELGKRYMAYIHIVDHSPMGAPEVPVEIKKTIKDNFGGTVILAGGFNLDSANATLAGEIADLIAIGRPFINNPDLVERLEKGLPLNDIMDYNTFYTPGSVGYTDYPFAQ